MNLNAYFSNRSDRTKMYFYCMVFLSSYAIIGVFLLELLFDIFNGILSISKEFVGFVIIIIPLIYARHTSSNKFQTYYDKVKNESKGILLR